MLVGNVIVFNKGQKLKQPLKVVTEFCTPGFQSSIFKDAQLLNVLERFVNKYEEFIVIFSIDLQLLKVDEKSTPAGERLFGNVTSVKLLQAPNVLNILVQTGISDWKVTFFKFVHEENALLIVVALKFKGKRIDFKLVQLLKVVLTVYLALLEHDAGKYTVCKLEQLENVLVRFTVVGLPNVGKLTNLTHSNDKQFVNVVWNVVQLFKDGSVTFFSA